ncbi:MAG: Ig-like domain-containing protein [Myxococcota bacterium]
MEPYPLTLRPVDDRVAPTVALLEPIDGEYLGADTHLHVVVNPVDDYGVDKVELRLDGALVATLEAAPWETDLDLPAPLAGSPVLTATAIDFGGNTAVASSDLLIVGVDLVAAGVTRLAPDDQSYDGQDVLVRDGTVVIDGPHSFGRLYVGRQGIITHSDATGTDQDLGPYMGIHVGLDLIADFVGVMPGGAIDVSGRGHRGECQASQGCFADYGAKHRGAARTAASAAAAPTTTPTCPSRPTTTRSRRPSSAGAVASGSTTRTSAAMAAAASASARARSAARGHPRRRRVGPTDGAGGAGGAIWIDVGALRNSGPITADGGTPRCAASLRRRRRRSHRHRLRPGRLRLRARARRPGPGGTPRAGAGTVVLAPEAGRATLLIHDGGRGPSRDNAALGYDYGTDPWVQDIDLVIAGARRPHRVAPAARPRPRAARRGDAAPARLDPELAASLDVEVSQLVVAKAAHRRQRARSRRRARGHRRGQQPRRHPRRLGRRCARHAERDLRRRLRAGRDPARVAASGTASTTRAVPAAAPSASSPTRPRLDGTISADGAKAEPGNPTYASGAGGAGGARCGSTGTLAGTGGITAGGGDNYPESDRAAPAAAGAPSTWRSRRASASTPSTRAPAPRRRTSRPRRAPCSCAATASPTASSSPTTIAAAAAMRAASAGTRRRRPSTATSI